VFASNEEIIRIKIWVGVRIYSSVHKKGVKHDHNLHLRFWKPVNIIIEGFTLDVNPNYTPCLLLENFQISDVKSIGKRCYMFATLCLCFWF
jgi:hypothetical protein